MTTDVQTVLIEREHEGEVLGAALRAAADGRGSFVLVEAAAGLGKTSLLAAAARQAEELGLRVLAARATELDRSLAFGVARQLLDPVLRSAPAALRRDLLRGLGRRVRAAAHRQGARRSRSAARSCCTPSTGWSPGSPSTARWRSSSTTPSGRTAARRTCSRSSRRGSASCPLRWWSPRGRRATRPAWPSGSRARPRSSCCARRRSASRAARRLPAPSSAASRRPSRSACHEATHGNPFYLRELVHALAADAVAPSAEAVRTLGPDTIARAALSRVFPLSPEAVGPAYGCSPCSTTGIELRHAAALAGLTAEEAAAAAAALVRAQVIADERALAFGIPSSARPSRPT